MRFIYYYPTYVFPSGGNKQLRLQAQILSELGIDAYLLRDEMYFNDPTACDDDHLYRVSLPNFDRPLKSAIQYLSDRDVLVLPEGRLDSVLPLCTSTKARIVINNQNGFYAIRYFPGNSALCHRIEAVISNSPYNCTVSRVAYQIAASKVYYVPHWVVRGDFAKPFADNTPKELGICYMPRKQPEIVNRIKKIIQLRHPEIPWIEIDKVPESEVSAAFRKYSMFFAAQHLEGCPLTALEAMACNCLVAGFPGTERFSHPYASDENGYWAKDCDVDSAVQRILEMIHDLQHNPTKIQRVREKGFQTAQRYSKANVKDALVRFVDGFQNGKKNIAHSESHDLQIGRLEERWNWSDYFYSLRKMHHYGRLGGFGGAMMQVVGLVRQLGRASR